MKFACSLLLSGLISISTAYAAEYSCTLDYNGGYGPCRNELRLSVSPETGSISATGITKKITDGWQRRMSYDYALRTIELKTDCDLSLLPGEAKTYSTNGLDPFTNYIVAAQPEDLKNSPARFSVTVMEDGGTHVDHWRSVKCGVTRRCSVYDPVGRVVKDCRTPHTYQCSRTH